MTSNIVTRCRWRGKLYSCSTADRAEQFGSEPELFLQVFTSTQYLFSALLRRECGP